MSSQLIPRGESSAWACNLTATKYPEETDLNRLKLFAWAGEAKATLVSSAVPRAGMSWEWCICVIQSFADRTAWQTAEGKG
jgi:hypothetical protein